MDDTALQPCPDRIDANRPGWCRCRAFDPSRTVLVQHAACRACTNDREATFAVLRKAWDESIEVLGIGLLPGERVKDRNPKLCQHLKLYVAHECGCSAKSRIDCHKHGKSSVAQCRRCPDYQEVK